MRLSLEHNFLFNVVDVLLTRSHSLDERVILCFSIPQFFVVLIILISEPVLLFFCHSFRLLSLVCLFLELIDSLLQLLSPTFEAPVLGVNIIDLLDVLFAFIFKFFYHFCYFLLVAFYSAFERGFGFFELLEVGLLALDEHTFFL